MQNRLLIRYTPDHAVQYKLEPKSGEPTQWQSFCQRMQDAATFENDTTLVFDPGLRGYFFDLSTQARIEVWTDCPVSLGIGAEHLGHTILLWDAGYTPPERENDGYGTSAGGTIIINRSF